MIVGVSGRHYIFRIRGLFVLLAMMAFVDVLAQSPVSTRYPWDKRAANCFEPAGAKDSRCELDNWPSWPETLQRVLLLYNTEQFVLLDRAMHELALSKKRFVNGDSPASAAYWAFRQLMPAPGVNESHQEKISRWRSAVPTSIFVPFAQSRFMYGNAWNVRGSGTIGSVSKESWELFSIRLQEAEKMLLTAPDALKDTLFWYQLLLAITLDGPHGHNRADVVFESAVKRWPTYFEFYELRLTRLVPKWGGSWGQVEAFIDKWSAQLAAFEGASLYARLYVSVKNQGVTPDQTAMNWVKMKRSLEDLTKRYPSPDFKNLYASYACFARDKDAFSAALKKFFPGELNRQYWLSGHSYEACMRWAGI